MTATPAELHALADALESLLARGVDPRDVRAVAGELARLRRLVERLEEAACQADRPRGGLSVAVPGHVAAPSRAAYLPDPALSVALPAGKPWPARKR